MQHPFLRGVPDVSHTEVYSKIVLSDFLVPFLLGVAAFFGTAMIVIVVIVVCVKRYELYTKIQSSSNNLKSIKKTKQVCKVKDPFIHNGGTTVQS